MKSIFKKILTAGLVMLGIEPKTQQLIMGIVFLVMVAVFADRETAISNNSSFSALSIKNHLP